MRRFIFMIALLFALLIFHTQVITGTENGLLLWYQTLIPSLLPFLLITGALAQTNAYQAVACHFEHSSFPIYEWIAVLLGNLCGYPLGGKLMNNFVRGQYISPARANQLLSAASQASPMFLIGYAYTRYIQDAIPLYVFLASIYIPTFLLFAVREFSHTRPRSVPASQYAPCAIQINDTFMHAVYVMVIIGMYVILFSVLLEILIGVLSSSAEKCVLSFLEITTGLHLLQQTPLPASLRFPLIGALSEFGGLCSAFQIYGVLSYPGASIKKYLTDKLALSAGTFCILYIWIH